MSLLERLMRDAATLGVALSAADAARLLELTQQLARWNRSYNLTAITDPEQMLTHHLLDSLSVHPRAAGHAHRRCRHRRRLPRAAAGGVQPGAPVHAHRRQRQEDPLRLPRRPPPRPGQCDRAAGARGKPDTRGALRHGGGAGVRAAAAAAGGRGGAVWPGHARARHEGPAARRGAGGAAAGVAPGALPRARGARTAGASAASSPSPARPSRAAAARWSP